MPTSLSPRRVLLEVCVTTVDDARTAVANGADRLELCSALEVGGVTPSPATFLEVRAAVAAPVVVLVRPLPGGFVYSAGEWATVERDADWFLAHGADGIVGGALDSSAGLDRERCRGLVRHAAGRAVLHRCFDFLPNLSDGLTAAIDLGFTRVLTSGGTATALEGAGVIRELVVQAGGRIQVLPGGGVRPENVAELVRATGCHQVHGSLRAKSESYPNPSLGMGLYTRTDATLVAATRAALDQITTGL